MKWIKRNEMEQNEAKSNKTDLNGLKLIEMDRNTTN